jgi:hypothetical protein
MRSLLAGLALFLAFVSGTAALTAYAAHEVLLDPRRAGEVLSTALRQPDLRERILSRAVPGYAQLPGVARTGVDALAATPSVDRALESVTVSRTGEVSLSPLQAALAAGLRSNGLGPVADAVSSAQGASVTVPPEYLDRYLTAQDTSRRVAVQGGLVAGLLLVVALVVSRDRRRTVRSAGITTLLACAAAAGLHLLLPTFVAASSARPEIDAVAAVVQAQRTEVLLALLPAVAAGLVLLAVGVLVPAPRRR